jgi:hypothetical protein
MPVTARPLQRSGSYKVRTLRSRSRCPPLHHHHFRFRIMHAPMRDGARVFGTVGRHVQQHIDIGRKRTLEDVSCTRHELHVIGTGFDLSAFGRIQLHYKIE